MPEYYLLGLYRFHAPFATDVVVHAMSIVARRLPGFFPGQMPVARKRSVPISSPVDFDPSLVPSAFTIVPGRCVTIPIIGNDGAELEIVETPGEAWCMKCSRTVPVASRADDCPECGSAQLQVTSGDAMRVLDFEGA